MLIIDTIGFVVSFRTCLTMPPPPSLPPILANHKDQQISSFRYYHIRIFT